MVVCRWVIFVCVDVQRQGLQTVASSSDEQLDEWAAVLSHLAYYHDFSLYVASLLPNLPDTPCSSAFSQVISHRMELLQQFHSIGSDLNAHVDYVKLINLMESRLVDFKHRDQATDFPESCDNQTDLSFYAGSPSPVITRFVMQSWYPVLSLLSSVAHQTETLITIWIHGSTTEKRAYQQCPRIPTDCTTPVTVETLISNTPSWLSTIYASVKVSDKMLIYSCVPKQGCGGTGDRLKGIVTAFLLSILVRRNFKIHSDFPFALSTIFEPASHDWRVYINSLIPDHLDYTDNETRFHQDILNGTLETYFDGAFPESPEAVTISINHLSIGSILSNPRFPLPELKKAGNIYKLVFEFLFKPTERLREASQSLLRASNPTGRPIIGIHFRSGSGLGQKWADPVRHRAADLETFLTCAKLIESEAQLENSVWLISSDVDSRTIKDLIVQMEIGSDRVRIITTTVSHIDRSNDIVDLVVRNGFLNAWASWWILSRHSSALVLSRSGFGETAARVSALPSNRMRFFHNCTATEFT